MDNFIYSFEGNRKTGGYKDDIIKSDSKVTEMKIGETKL